MYIYLCLGLFIMYNYLTVYYNLLKIYHYINDYVKYNNLDNAILYYRLDDFKVSKHYLEYEKYMLVRYPYKNKYIFLIYNKLLLPNDNIHSKIQNYKIRWPLVELIYNMKYIDVTNEMNMMYMAEEILFNNKLARILMFIKTNQDNLLINYKWNIMTPTIEIYSGTDIIINNKLKNI